LGLKHDCSEREIDVSFQRLSRKWHPDKNKGNDEAAEKFTDVNDAYATLKDAQKRRIYDLYGEGGVHLYEAPKSEMNEIFGIAHSDDPNSVAVKVRKKGKTYQILFPVDLTDFYNSRHYDLLVTRRAICRCPHQGFFCPKCRAHATIRENATLSFFVEKGCDEGTIILFKNAGDTSEANAPSDIEIMLVSKPHRLFKRQGSDLHVDVPITLKEALLGFNRTLKNVDGSDVVIESTEPVGSDRTLRVRGKGLPLYLYPGEYGDIVVHAIVKGPKELTAYQREQLVKALK
jgi:DnaJ-class molecular chaperone